MFTTTTPAPTVKTLFVIDYTVADANPDTRDRTNSVEAANLRDAIDIIECDFSATTIHAIYTADGKRVY